MNCDRPGSPFGRDVQAEADNLRELMAWVGLAGRADAHITSNVEALKLVEKYPQMMIVPVSAPKSPTPIAMLLPHIVGPKRAKEILLTGNDRITSEQAAEWGLINRAVGEGKLLRRARRVALEIARNDQLAVRVTKQAITVPLWSVTRRGAGPSIAHLVKSGHGLPKITEHAATCVSIKGGQDHIQRLTIQPGQEVDLHIVHMLQVRPSATGDRGRHRDASA